MAPACTRSRMKHAQRKQQTSTSASHYEMNTIVEKENEDDVVCSSGCSTPKAKRFRIPEVLTCPPAPKKTRVTPNCSSNKTPIAFFASLDIELFFFSALRNHDVSA